MKGRWFVCPSCGGTDVTEMPTPQLGQTWRCACGFEGSAFLEAESEEAAKELGDALRG